MGRVGSIVDDVGATGTVLVSCFLLPVKPKRAAVVAAPTAADAPATAASVNLDMLLTGGMRASMKELERLYAPVDTRSIKFMSS